MNNRLLTVMVILLAASGSYAQQFIWAKDVIETNDERESLPYSTYQVVGKPNVLPQYGSNPNAWEIKANQGSRYVHVSFSNKMPIKQIAIAVSWNPGALEEVGLYDEEGNYHLVTQFIPQNLPLSGRVKRIFLDETPFSVAGLKLSVNTSVVGEPTAIDAIGVSADTIPVPGFIHLSEDIFKEYEALRLDSMVNSEFKELKPLIGPDEKTLYFSRRNHPENIGGLDDGEDIWYSEWNDSIKTWQKARNMGEPLNNRGPNFISSITQEGNTTWLLLGNKYLGKNRMTAGASISQNTEDGWSVPEPVEIENFFNYSPYTDFFLSHSRKVLIMSIEQRNTYGARDLYVSIKQANGSWGEPINLGETINTASDETAPFVAADDSTVYFSSKGFSGYGGFDLYVTKRLDSTWTRWSEPENLGPTINSSLDDIFFYIARSDPSTAYFCRGNQTDADIFKVKVPEFQRPLEFQTFEEEIADPVITLYGKVFDKKSGRVILDDTVHIDIANDTLTFGKALLDTTGTYRKQIYPSTAYKLKFYKKGYFPYDSILNVGRIDKDSMLRKDIYVQPVELNKPIVLDNIYFDFDKATLRKESYAALNKVLQVLKDNPDYRIKFSGHTCSMGSDAYNLGLSNRRANSVMQYFLGKEIDPERMESKGYGEQRPIESNATEAGREKNRRVEFELLDGSS